MTMKNVESKLNALEKKVFAKGTIKEEDRIHVFYGHGDELEEKIATLKDRLCKKYSLGIEEVEKEITIITVTYSEESEGEKKHH
jgi:hypothetical protein